MILLADELKARTLELNLQADPKAVLDASSWLMDELEQEAGSTEEQIAVIAVLTSVRVGETERDAQAKIQDVKADCSAIETELKEAKDRIAKLEDLVRALTAQRASTSTPSPRDSPQLAQRLPVNAGAGQALDLNVPRGSPIALGMSNQKGHRRGIISLETLMTVKHIVQGNGS